MATDGTGAYQIAEPTDPAPEGATGLYYITINI